MRPVFLRFLAAFIALWLSRDAFAAAEGSDLEFGAPGDGPGQFSELRDLTCGPGNVVYTLEGVRWDDQRKHSTGNGRVQKFSPEGKPLAQFPLREAAIGQALDPARIAVDSAGRIYVTDAALGEVRQFDGDGTLLKTIAVPNAFGITRWTVSGQERIAVLPYRFAVIDGKWQKVGGDKLVPISLAGEPGEAIPLERTLTGVSDIAADRSGNLYVIADVNQLYKFAPNGKLITTIGAGESSRTEDGSEVLHSVAVDSKGTIYTMTWGNPGCVVQFSPDLSTVRIRGGQFKWADPWSVHSSYVPLAVDGDDRLWVAATHTQDPNGVNFKHYRAVPAVVRTIAGYFADDQNGVSVASAQVLGFKPVIEVALPNRVGYDLKPVPLTVVLTKANRQVQQTEVTWRVLDMYRTELATGTFTMPLKNGSEARHELSFTPPRYGWYAVVCDFAAAGKPLTSVAEFFGITQRYPGMVTLDEPGEDSASVEMRQGFSGLMNMRLHAQVNDKDSLNHLDHDLALADRAGLTTFVQFSDRRDCDPAFVRDAVTRFKGRVKVWEVMNEPNFSFGNPAEYVLTLKAAAQAIKAADPAALVMGPDVCGIDLNWYAGFYKAGGKEWIDILSIHDYEGHESISPEHWRWKIGELRTLMAQNGDADKPLWQTERAISGVRGGNWLGAAQAVRMTLHRDLLAALGVAPEHNNHYYLADHGFNDCPSWVWSRSGPHPAAFALRTRHALTHGRAYRGTLDFGVNGNDCFLGLRYVGTDGATVVLSSLGTLDTALDFSLRGGDAVELIDAFGNSSRIAAQAGVVRLTVGQMPSYVRLAAGQELEAPRIALGRNIAARASIAYSAKMNADPALLVNGTIETYHAGNPAGGTDGKAIWSGELPQPGQILELAFRQPRTIGALVVHGVHADNGFCALLDYDLEYHDAAGAWKKLDQVRAPCPPSDTVKSASCAAATWYLDHNLYLHRFAPIATDRLRLVVLRVSNGFVPDSRSRAWGKIIDAKLMIREIEVFSPPTPLSVSATVAAREVDTISVAQPITMRVDNRSGRNATVIAQLQAPRGWTAAPAQTTVTVAAGAFSEIPVTLTPPAEIAAGSVPLDLVLSDERGQQLDVGALSLVVKAPLVGLPQAPRIHPDGALLSIAVKNLGAGPLSGVARALVSGKSPLPPLERRFGPIAPGQSATVDFDFPGLVLAGASWHADYAIVAERVVVGATQDLSVRAWSVLGPFANDFTKDFGPESGVDLAKTSVDQQGNERRWREVTTEPDGLLDLKKALSPNENVCAYAVAYVRAPTTRKALLTFGSDDGDKAWVNGRQVHADDSAHAAIPGQNKLPIELKSGWNEILFKITQGGGGWGMYCDLESESGARIADLEWAPRRP